MVFSLFGALLCRLFHGRGNSGLPDSPTMDAANCWKGAGLSAGRSTGIAAGLRFVPPGGDFVGVKTLLPLVVLAMLPALAKAALMQAKFDLVYDPIFGGGLGPSVWINYDNSFSEIKRGQGIFDLWINTGDVTSYAVKNGVEVGSVGFFFSFRPGVGTIVGDFGSTAQGEFSFSPAFDGNYEVIYRRVNPQPSTPLFEARGYGKLVQASIPEGGQSGAMLAGSLALIGLLARRLRA